MKIGSHVGLSAPELFLGSVKEALSYGATAFMIYTGAPQNTRRGAIETMKIVEGQKLMVEEGLSMDGLIVHAPYIMNMANPDPDKYQFSVNFLAQEIKRSAAFGAKQIVLHPGAHVGTGEEDALRRIIKGLNEVISHTDGLDVKIALETMAGKGSEVGKTFEELETILSSVNNPDRLSICFDTCHTHDYGYNVKDDFDGVMAHFDHLIGKDKISVFHINDSKNPTGARKDRHENIGFGFIGFEALNSIVNHKDFLNVPKILETPYVKTDDEHTYAPYKEEIRNFRNQEFMKDGILSQIHREE